MSKSLQKYESAFNYHNFNSTIYQQKSHLTATELDVLFCILVKTINMKITFLADELIELGISIDPVQLEESPSIGDYISIVDFIADEEKETFLKYIESLNKVSLGTVDGRVWNKQYGENNLQLSLYFEELAK